MRIEELYIKGFGKWQDATFRFSPGINLFAAPNEAGKSTLLQALFAALYGMKRDYVKTTRYLPEYEKYRPWHQGEYETVITYQMSGKTYRLHRTLQKEREQARVFLLPEWTELTDVYHEDRRKERDFIERHLGLTRSLFTDVTWIRREPLASGEHLLPALQGDAEGDEAAPLVRRILDELEREANGIGKKERAENTLLGKAAALAAQKEQELLHARSVWNEVSQLTRQIAEWEEEKRVQEQRKKRLQQRKERALQQVAALQERWQQSYAAPDEAKWEWWEETAFSPKERLIHQQARQALAELHADGHNDRTDPNSQEERQAEWERLTADYELGLRLRRDWETAHLQLARTAATAMSASAGARRQRARAKQSGWPAYPVWLWVAACLFAGMGAISFLFAEWGKGTVAFALAVLAAWFGAITSRKRAGGAQEQPMAPEWQQWQQEAGRLDAELARLLGRWGAADWDSFLALRETMRDQLQAFSAERFRTQASRREEAAAILRDWGERVRECLTEEQKKWEQELEACRDEEAQREQRLQELREQIARANGQLQAHEGISLAKAQSEYEAAVREVKQLQIKREALKLAGDTLREAATAWNRDLSAAVSGRASQLMAQISGGAYRDVRLHPQEGFRIRLLEPRSQQVLEQEQCSTGTQDQLYFAQRLALFLHVSAQTEPLPLFLDDHFVHYDQKRLEQALRYLAALGEEHQVFLFSCTERERRFLEPLLAASERHTFHSLG